MTQPIILLVHGTHPRGWLFPATRLRIAAWLRRPRPPLWFEAGSAFREVVAAELNETGADFHVVDWSGANTFAARLDAAGRIQKALRDVRAQNPAAPLFVVAHSHGGTAAAHALHELDDGIRLSGAVTLATPYPYMYARTFDDVQAAALAMGAFGFGVVPFVWMLWQVVFAMIALMPGNPAAEPLGIFAAMLLGQPVLWFGWYVYQQWRHWRVEWLRRLDLTVRVPVPLLALRAPGDEATLALSAAQMLAVAVRQVWRFSTIPGLIIRRFGKRGRQLGMASVVLTMVAIPVCDRIWGGLSSDKPGFWIVSAIMAVAISTFAPLFLMILISAVLMPPALLASGVAMIPFGRELVFAAFFVDATVEAVPPGGPHLLEIVSGDEFRSTPVSMRHSIHELPVIRRRIARWIAQRIAADERVDQRSLVVAGVDG